MFFKYFFVYIDLKLYIILNFFINYFVPLISCYFISSINKKSNIKLKEHLCYQNNVCLIRFKKQMYKIKYFRLKSHSHIDEIIKYYEVVLFSHCLSNFSKNYIFHSYLHEIIIIIK